jgi:hypothetical protein
LFSGRVSGSSTGLMLFAFPILIAGKLLLLTSQNYSTLFPHVQEFLLHFSSLVPLLTAALVV